MFSFILKLLGCCCCNMIWNIMHPLPSYKACSYLNCKPIHKEFYPPINWKSTRHLFSRRPVRSTRAQWKGKRKRKAETIILEKPSLHCKGGTAYKKRQSFWSPNFQTSRILLLEFYRKNLSPDGGNFMIFFWKNRCFILFTIIFYVNSKPALRCPLLLTKRLNIWKKMVNEIWPNQNGLVQINC